MRYPTVVRWSPVRNSSAGNVVIATEPCVRTIGKEAAELLAIRHIARPDQRLALLPATCAHKCDPDIRYRDPQGGPYLTGRLGIDLGIPGRPSRMGIAIRNVELF